MIFSENMQYMANKFNNPFGYGSVLIDNSTLNLAGAGLTSQTSTEAFKAGLYELLESLVIHDRLYVEGSAFEKDKHAQHIAALSGGLIQPFQVSKEELNIIYEAMFRYFHSSYGGDKKMAPLLRYSKYVFEQDSLYPLSGQVNWHNLGRPQILVVRTLIYFFLSQFYKIPYVPSSFRNGLLLHFFKESSSVKFKCFADKAIHFIEKAAAKNADSLNKDFDDEIIVVSLPILENLIPYNPDNLGKMFEDALKLREAKATKAFRNWCTKTDKDIAEGKIKTLFTARTDLQVLRDQILNLSPEPKKLKSSLSLGLSPSVDFDIEIPLQRYQHLIFLRNLFEKSFRVPEPTYFDWYRSSYN